MTENDKVIVQTPEKQKIELPMSFYLQMFVQIVLLVLIVWNTGDAAEILALMYLGF